MEKTINSRLNKAKAEKNDEFYTPLSDIEYELKRYKEHFKDKIILCNCDDPYESNFFKYFAMNFNEFKLKKLIATCFNGSPVGGTQLSLFDEDNTEITKSAHQIVINEVKDYNKDGVVNLYDVEYLLKNKKNTLTKLKGNGDFRSKECVDLLDEADIVITNPPFSLFREYMGKLVQHNKKFIILGNKNAITYKEIFRLIKENKVWIGYRNMNNDIWFEIPEGKQYEKIIDGKKVKHMSVMWLTNLDISKRHESFVCELYKKYNPKEYPKYDNYNAVEVSKVSDIPMDYFGAMGVPITFLDKYNPKEFDIFNCSAYSDPTYFGCGSLYVNKNKVYARVIIKRRK